jgi:hypothetical protein
VCRTGAGEGAHFALNARTCQWQVYLAYCVPYTFSLHMRQLQQLMRQPVAQQHLRRQWLCTTVYVGSTSPACAHGQARFVPPIPWRAVRRGGNVCELVTITDFSASPAVIAGRPVVVVTSRVHPGETPASWAMQARVCAARTPSVQSPPLGAAQGLLQFATSESSEAAELRRAVVLKVVPVLNPDGVIDGNNRCNLRGVDLNRMYTPALRDNHPTVRAVHQVRIADTLSAVPAWLRAG